MESSTSNRKRCERPERFSSKNLRPETDLYRNIVAGEENIVPGKIIIYLI